MGRSTCALKPTDRPKEKISQRSASLEIWCQSGLRPAKISDISEVQQFIVLLTSLTAFICLRVVAGRVFNSQRPSRAVWRIICSPIHRENWVSREA